MASNILTVSKHFAKKSSQNSHVHYYFKLKYNNVERMIQALKKCDNRGYRPGDIFINKSRGMRKKASEPDLESFRDKYFVRKDILRILDGSVVAKSECATVMEDIKMKVIFYSHYMHTKDVALQY